MKCVSCICSAKCADRYTIVLQYTETCKQNETSKQKSELAYTSNYTLIDTPPQAQIGLQTTTTIPNLKTALLLMLSLLPVSLLLLSLLLRLQLVAFM